MLDQHKIFMMSKFKSSMTGMMLGGLNTRVPNTKCERTLIKGAFTLDVKSMFLKNLGGILGGMQCYIGDNIMLSEC
jgi:hypothetical protein